MTNKPLIAVALLVAVAVGFIAGSRFGGSAPGTSPSRSTAAARQAAVPFDYQPPPPKISVREAKTLRDDHYEDMSSIGDVLELPTDFAQTEALFVLAGRANASQLEDYIRQATGIAHRYDRRTSLEVLFLRYAELDANAALAFLDDIDLDIETQMISSMFRSWAKEDLQGAIDRANSYANIDRRKKAGYAILTAIARTDPGLLDAVSGQLADKHNLHWLRGEMLGVRANYDPQTALTEALKMGAEHVRSNAMQTVGRVWARSDPLGAYASAEQISNRQERMSYVHSVISRWIEDDPNAAMQHLLAQPTGPQRDMDLSTALHTYAGIDPAAALTVAQQLSGQHRSSAMHTIFSQWAREDPAAALAEMANLSDPEQRSNVIGSIANALAYSDPDYALRWLSSLPEAQRRGMQSQIFGRLSQSDPQRALELAAAIDSPADRREAMASVLGNMAHINPELAARHIDELPTGPRYSHMRGQIASQWASQDPQAALAWASGLTGQTYRDAMSRIAEQLAHTDPDLASSMVGQVRGEARSAWIRSVSAAYAQRDPQRALAWAQQYRSDPAYGDAVAALVPHLALRDPHYALRVAGDLTPDRRQQATNMVLHTWTERDPAAAARWATGSTAADRRQAVNTVASAWVQADPLAAANWARSLRSGETRDNALMAVALGSNTDQTGRIGLLNAIASDQTREQAVSGVYMQLRSGYDGEVAARDFLDRVDISDDLRRRLERQSGG